MTTQELQNQELTQVLPQTLNSMIELKAVESGLDKTEAQQVKASFIPMITKVEELENEYNEVIKLEISPETCEKAKELRLKFVKLRTGTAAIHKKAKEYYWNGGKAVDGFKNVVTFAIQGKEEELQKMEDHFENLEKERILQLTESRREELKSFEVDNLDQIDLGSMNEAVYDIFRDGMKKKFEEKKEAEKKAQEEKEASEKKALEEQEQIRKDNDRLKKEAEENAKKLEKERADNIKKQQEADAKAKKDREDQEAKLAKEREKNAKKQKEIEDKARKEKEASDKKIANEKAKAQKIADDLAAERAKAKKIEDDKKELEEAQNRRDEQDKASKELLEKKARYQKFLLDNAGKYDSIFHDKEKGIVYLRKTITVSEFII